MKASDKFMFLGLGFLASVVALIFGVNKWYNTNHGDPEAGIDDPPSQW